MLDDDRQRQKAESRTLGGEAIRLANRVNPRSPVRRLVTVSGRTRRVPAFAFGDTPVGSAPRPPTRASEKQSWRSEMERCPASGPHRQTILDWHAAGKSIQEIGTGLGVNFATVDQVLRRAGRVTKKRRRAPLTGSLGSLGRPSPW